MWKRLVHFPAAGPFLVILYEKIFSSWYHHSPCSLPLLQHGWSRKAAHRSTKPPRPGRVLWEMPMETRALRQGVRTLPHIFPFFSCGVTPPFPLLILLLPTSASRQPLYSSGEVRNLSSQGKPRLCCTQHLASTVISNKLHSLHSGLKRLKFCTLNSLMINIMEFNVIILSFMKITKSRICSKQNLNIQNECLAGTDLVQWISRFKYNRWKQKQKKHIWTKHFFFLQEKKLIIISGISSLLK